MGESPRCDLELEARLSVGTVRLCLMINNGAIRSCKVYSDCLDESLPQTVSDALTGLPFDKTAMCSALTKRDETKEIAAWIESSDL